MEHTTTTDLAALAENAGGLDLLADLEAPPFSPVDHTLLADLEAPPSPMDHTTSPDLITMDALPVRAGASVRRRMGSPAALAAALAALEPDQETLVGARASQWREQLTALEDARQALLDDRQHWLEGVPTVRVMISVIRGNATRCYE